MKKKDITILYDKANMDQLMRLIKAGSKPHMVTKERADKLTRLRLCRIVG